MIHQVNITFKLVHFIPPFLFFLIPALIQAQPRDTLYLWPGNVPGETEEKHPPVETTNKKGNVTRLTDVTHPALVVFEPEEQHDSGLGVIVCPGGGYNILAVDLEGYEIATWLNELGYTAFVLQYRVPQKQAGACRISSGLSGLFAVTLPHGT